MQEIEQFDGGGTNRGEVRIITDGSEQNYVYTTDHEKTFSEPCAVPKQ
ncbi:MAG: hypothetical protein NTU49_06240 [Gammaproteobacteria bacterium]|nr:hypothetical protein [Gammaproteobacteria bacterium]